MRQGTAGKGDGEARQGWVRQGDGMGARTIVVVVGRIVVIVFVVSLVVVDFRVVVAVHDVLEVLLRE